jgi:Tol biopolymer transport system component
MRASPGVSRRSLHALWLGLVLVSPPLPPHGRKLSGALARLVRADVTDFQPSADGARAVYLADRELDDVFELYACSTLADEPVVRISGPLVTGGDVRPGFRISALGQRVAYLADALTDEKVELFSAPLDGDAPAVRLNLPGPASGDVLELRLDPAGQNVVFLADGLTDETFELFSVPIDGSRPPVRLNTPLALGGDVVEFQIGPDGQRVVFRADARDNVFELFAAPIRQEQGALRLHAALPSLSDVEAGFAFGADSSTVVYRVDQDLNEELELFAVAADASSAPRQLNAALVAGGDVEGFALASDSARLVYRADQEQDGVSELFGVALAGGPTVKLSPALAPDRDVAPELALAPDSARVVFRADASTAGAPELYSAPLDGSAPAARLDDSPLVAGAIGAFALAADSTRVAFLAPTVGGARQLFSAALDDSTPVRELGGALVSGGDVADFVLAGELAVFRADRDADETLELYRAPLDGSGGATKLHDDLRRLLDVLPGYRADGVGLGVLYLADAARDEVFELHRAALDGPPDVRILSESLRGEGQVVGGVQAWRMAGERALYLADAQLPGVRELFSVPLNGSELPRRLTEEPIPGSSISFDLLVSPDDRRAVFLLDRELDDQFELYSVPVDGSARPVKLNGALPLGGDVTRFFGITPDARTVVYQADQEKDEQFEIYSVPIDGSGTPLRLDPALHRYSDAGGALFSPDSRFVFYVADRVVRDKHELYRVPVDGSGPPLKLSFTPAPGGDVQTGMTLSPDGSRVVYPSDADQNDVYELYSVPADGSAPPVKLNGPLVQGGDVFRFVVSADGTRVLYVADQEADHRVEFYSAPIDGSSPAVRVFGATRARVTGSVVTTLSGLMVFQASFSYLEGRDLYVAPVDASVPPRRLNDPVLSHRSVDSFGVTPDGTTAVYVAAQVRGPEVWVVPLDGSAAPRRLTAAMRGRDHAGFGLQIDAKGERVLFEVHIANRYARDLFLAPLDGSEPPIQVNTPIASNRSVQSWSFLPDGSGVLYLAPIESSHNELFATYFGLRPTLAPGFRLR